MLSTSFKTLSDLVTFLAQSFKLSAIVPAFIFLFLHDILIVPYLPAISPINNYQNLDLTSKYIGILVGALLLGYSLSIMNIPLIQLYEGYPWRSTWYGRLLVKVKIYKRKQFESLINLYHEMDEQIDEIDKQLEQLGTFDEQRNELGRKSATFRNILIKERPLVEQVLRDYFPPEDSLVLPTSMGNVMAAFESYPWIRYQIDAVALWPRIVPILTNNKFAAFVEREKAGLDFVLNFSILFFVLSIENCFIGLLYSQDPITPLILSGVLLILSLLFYKISILGAGNWGMTVRVAFDLYRYELLQSLYLKMPDSFDREKQIWSSVSAFLRKNSMTDESPFSSLIDYERINLLGRKENEETKTVPN